MPDNFSKLNSLLQGREALSQDVLRPLFTGPIIYSDGHGNLVDLLSFMPRTLPKRYLSSENLPKPIRVSREQCIGLVRAFRNHNSVEAACLLTGVKVRDFQDMQRTWAVGRTKEDAIPAQYRNANQFIDNLFFAFSIATDLAEREYIQVVSSAALRGSTETTTKSVTYFDENGKAVGGKTETVTKVKPPDANVAIWWLERTDPGRWGQKKQIEHGGTVHHNHIHSGIGEQAEADPLSVVMGAIEKIGRNPLPMPEMPDTPEEDVMDAEFSEDQATSDDDGGNS